MTPATEAPDSALTKFRTFFQVAAVYDLVLGAAFFLLYAPIFSYFSIPLPENTSYLHLAAAFVFVQGVGYWYVARNPARNVDLVKVGLIYKIVYVLVAAYYLAIGQIPHSIFAWFAVFDFIFAVLFARFLMVARPYGGAAVAR